MSIRSTDPSLVTPFEMPALSPDAALRDRATEAAEHAARRRDDGYADGFRAGLAAAEADLARQAIEHRRAVQRLATAAAAVEQAAARLRAADAVTLRALEREAIALGVELAAEIVGHELRAVDDRVLDAVQRSIALVPDRSHVTVRVHPDDVDTLVESMDAGRLPDGGDVSLAPDPSIERGGCVVHAGECHVDGQVATAIARLRAAFAGDLLASSVDHALSVT